MICSSVNRDFLIVRLLVTDSHIRRGSFRGSGHDHWKRHEDEFSHASEFQEYRNRLGGLLLLPKRFNASYGDLPYSDKREHYFGQNLLAQSLYEKAYERNPGFLRFIRESGLPFKPHAKFLKSDLDERQALYQQLAEQIWSPSRLAE